MTEYIYIAQSSLEMSKCKIGITDNLDRRLTQYNNMTGKSKDNVYIYLFTAEVKNMREVENDTKTIFTKLRETKNKEMYFYNDILFDEYVEFIKNHSLFIKEVPIKKPKEKIKVVREKGKTLIERGKEKIDIMNMAKKVKDDEFYTLYKDVEKEVENYIHFFKDKVVFCNCDDPYNETNESRSSAFALYFYKNFKKLKLKKLICLHYSGGIDLFSQGSSGIIFTTDGKNWQQKTPKNYNGSFDHPLSIKILNEEADIVCTNPPFSKAREYWKLLLDSKKKFLIISNISNTIHTFYIKCFKNKKMWSGINRVDWYMNPRGLKAEAAGHWYTNIPVKKHNSTIKLIPLKDISERDKKFDDKGILNIDRCKIPNDYDKPFAVSARPILQRVLEYGFEIVQEKEYIPYIDKKMQFSRVLIQKIKSI
ncbi:MAG: hypothetical protein Ta2D_05700 [Rickettsiales bacterium]|nr:MAG: hypothetical protein Ta2D_05700 [Rickettsiales bacterium]